MCQLDGCENGAAGDEVMARELEVVDDHPLPSGAVSLN
jgi:hypothetical protein